MGARDEEGTVQNARHRVVVLAGSFGALGIVRDLGKQGVPSIVMGRAEYVGKSRYSKFIRTSTLDDILRELKALPVEPDEKLILLTDNDVYIEFIHNHWEELSKHYVMPTHPDNSVLTDKTQLDGAARMARIPVPATYSGNEQWEITQFPVIVKPIQRDLLWQQPFIKREKAYECHSRDELEAVLRMMQDVHVDSITQEIIVGDLERLYCITLYRNRQGQILIGDVLQKLGQFPADYGTGTALVTVHHPKLIEYSTRLLESVNYVGVAMIEYKYCAKRDDFYLIEVNGRFPAFAGIMGKLGNAFAVNIYKDLAASVSDATKSPVRKSAYHPYKNPLKPVLWLYLLNDLRWSARRSILSVFKYIPYLWKYNIQAATWDWKDPAPCVHYYITLLFRRLFRKRSKTVPKVQQPSFEDA